MQLTLPKYLFSFDVESIGLMGEGFAVGWVLFDLSPGLLMAQRELCSKLYWTPPERAQGNSKDRVWVRQNVPYQDWLDRYPEQYCPRELRSCFWNDWDTYRDDAVMAADCPIPVETNFLQDCIDDDATRQPPYPFWDIASIRILAGHDPVATYPRLEAELPAHDPVCDARQSGRLLLESFEKAGLL